MPIDPITKDDKLTLLFYLFIRQMGGIADCLRHIQSTKQGAEYSNEEINGWIAHAQTELADTSMLVRKMCSTLGINYDTTVTMGIVRDIEKKDEYLQRHPGAHWI